jgi:xanthine dehydrogenase large subunit
LRGESVYLDDIPLVEGTLFAAVFDSPLAHGRIRELDITEAERSPGVVRVFRAEDIPGQNQIGGIVPDEELLATTEVHFCGMPVALVVAQSEEEARAALLKIKIQIEPLEIITDSRIAREKEELTLPPRTFLLGDPGKAWETCDHIFEGRADTNGQEHLYIETQGAYSVPLERGAIRVYSSTQGPTAVQRTLATVLGMSMHEVEVDTTRLGGGFGGKEDQATAWAILCALATYHLGKPVKLALHRMDDMRMTGKRNPYSSDYRIGLSNDLKILAYEVEFFQNSGAAADLSPAVMERTLFHCTNSYFIPNVKATAYCCRTNLPPNTAFRGFGGPQGMFVIESAIDQAARHLGITASVIQEKNLIRDGEEFPFGQKAESEAIPCWSQALSEYGLENLKNETELFNEKNSWYKKGLALMPVCFGISFTKTRMNQGRALVHVYTDGSIGVSTGAVEMGQGVNTKILQVVSAIFDIDPARVKIHSTNTYRIANTSPTAASAAADLNGRATELACRAILDRMIKVAAEVLKADLQSLQLKKGKVLVDGNPSILGWEDLVMQTYNRRISLSEHAHYTPPGIHFDPGKEKGHPFSYHVYGTAIVGVTVDCLRGVYEVDYVKAVHDFGTSLNPIVDRGQCEGGVVQGIGWMTMEEIVYDEKGRLRSNALSTYKIPDIYSVPREISILPLKTQRDNLAVFKSKAVGEPPLMYGIGAYFALCNAIRAFNPKAEIPYDAPMTPEKVLLHLYKHAEKSADA